MNIADDIATAYKEGFEAGQKNRDHEGWYAMELTEAIDRLTEDKKALQNIIDNELTELRVEIKRLAVMMETYITEQRFKEKQGRAHP